MPLVITETMFKVWLIVLSIYELTVCENSLRIFFQNSDLRITTCTGKGWSQPLLDRKTPRIDVAAVDSKSAGNLTWNKVEAKKTF